MNVARFICNNRVKHKLFNVVYNIYDDVVVFRLLFTPYFCFISKYSPESHFLPRGRSAITATVHAWQSYPAGAGRLMATHVATSDATQNAIYTSCYVDQNLVNDRSAAKRHRWPPVVVTSHPIERPRFHRILRVDPQASAEFRPPKIRQKRLASRIRLHRICFVHDNHTCTFA